MNTTGYRMVVLYRFQVGGEVWETEGRYNNFVRIEETTKNGQEDCHMYGEFIKTEAGWEVLMDGDHPCENISEYDSPRMLAGIIQFLNTYGVPKKEE